MVKLATQDTYIYIDVSNIRAACRKTLGLRLDFVRLLGYFQRKYPNLKDVRYYEGVATGDVAKRRTFDNLREKGYTICPLERKSYISTEVEERETKCPRCGNKWTTRFKREHKMMKSNVDVYLATELLAVAHDARKLTHIILVSCDGDYAEMIKHAIERNENIAISVLATPSVRDLSKNTMSVRLRKLYDILPKGRYSVINIDTIRKDVCVAESYISQK